VPSAPRIAALLALAGAAVFASACSGGGGSSPVPATSTSPSTSPASSPTPWKPTIQEFSLAANRMPVDIVAGADGNLWFNEPNASMIGRMSTSGTLIGEYPVSNTLQAGSLSGIALGSDNNVWFGDLNANFIAKIDTSGNITEISLPTNTSPALLTSGPDGNIWFSTASGVGKLAPTSTATPTLYTLSTTSSPGGIISGPNNEIWFSEPLAGRVGHVATNASGLQEYPIPIPSASYLPAGLTAGSDGAIWTAGQAYYTNGTGQISVIGRVTTSGQISYFLTPTQISANILGYIVTGPDNFLYAPESGHDPVLGNTANIARINPQTGHIDEAAVPSGSSNGFGGITVGPDGNIWFTETGSSKIGRLLLH
jgi:virginiamycin B lyase